MKTISFIRHAKSDRTANLPDFERTLSKRGLSDAPIMGKLINNSFIKPDVIISSPANRAFTTAKLIAAEIGYPEDEIMPLDDLYFAEVDTYLSILSLMDDDIDNIYVFSHNPGTTEIINRVSNTRLDNMPTCGIAQISFDMESWQDIFNIEGKLLKFEIPKNHR